MGKKKKYKLFAWVDESISGGPVPTLDLYLSTKGPRGTWKCNPQAYTFHSWSALYRKILELQRIWDVLLPLELEIQLRKEIHSKEKDNALL